MATPYRTWVEISKAQLSANFREVKRVAGSGIDVLPVVKGNAYGHGAEEVARLLVSEGARWVAVSNIEEGAALRRAGFESRILVMADFLPSSRMAMLEEQLTPVIHSLDDLTELNQLAAARGERVRFHLKLDSGMGRLGTRSAANEIARVLDACPYVVLEGMMTHFASVTDFNTTQTEDQVRCFNDVADGLARLGRRPEYLHVAGTGGIAYRERAMLGNLVRPGLALYGYVPPSRGGAPASKLNLRPALAWKAAVLTVKEIPQGALVGYGGAFRAQQPMRIAVVAVGYADGLPHQVSNRGRVIACGRFANIIGAVSMNVTTIDVTLCPGIAPGDAVTIIGEEEGLRIDAQEIAQIAGTISYSILCGIRDRVHRVTV